MSEKKGREVYQYDMRMQYINTYPSISCAARAMNCNESTIRTALNRKTPACNFLWKDTLVGVSHIQWVNNATITTYPKEAFLNSILKENPNVVKISDPVNDHVKEYLKPNILILDIETSPMRGFIWKLWKENVGIEKLISDWFMLTWSCKWLGEKTIMSDRLTGKEAKEEDDIRIVKKLWILLNEADIVIAHYGKKFDIPKINTRFIIHKLNPPSAYKQIDTCDVAKRQFGFSSNKLQALADHFGFKGKIDTTFELWRKCMDGDESSLEYMEEYNKQDVILLEQVYLRLRPWIKNHPNIGTYLNEDSYICTNCGSSNMVLESKGYNTNVLSYNLFRCGDCGAMARSKTKLIKSNTKLRNISLC